MSARIPRAFAFGVCAAALVTSAAAQEAPPDPDPFAGSQILGDAALAAEVVAPEASTIAQSTQILTATNSGNTVNGETVDSGDIVLNSDAFAGFGGIGNFVMNTGHNNNLQGSVSVVVVMTPP